MEKSKKKNEICIIIDKKIVDLYTDWYFTIYPKRHKKPIESPIVPSLNQWSILRRPHANYLKQCWKDFVVWIVQEKKLSNKKILICNILIKYFFRTKQRRDADNYSGKFILDGLVQSGLLEDDNFNNIISLTIQGNYDKLNPRTELYIYY